MKKIHKYTLRHTSTQRFPTLPADVTILSIQQQATDVCMWVEIDPGKKVEKPLEIVTILTGEDAPDSRRAKYITTCQHGALVLHYYRLTV